MADLNLEKNVADPDQTYQMLMDLHEGCTPEESSLRNAKLILTLINHIGDEQIISQAIRIAAETTPQKKAD